MSPKRTLIFIPGIYGSTLVDRSSRKKEWASVPHMLLGQMRLACPVPGGSSPRVSDLEAGEVLDRVPLVTDFIAMNAYGRILNRLERLCATFGADLLPLAYDWRQNPKDALLRLSNTIDQLRARDPGAEVFIFAHSFGALITSYFLRYGKQDYAEAQENWEGLERVNGIVLATAPYHGANVVFRNILQGATFQERVTVITQSDYASFPAAYFLLPPNGNMDIYHTDLKRADIDILDVGTWENAGWGLFSRLARRRHSDPAQVAKYLHTVLSEKSAFDRKQFMPISKKPNSKAQLISFIGEGTPTLERGVWLASEGRTDIVAFDALDLERLVPHVDRHWSKVDGDGTLSKSSQRMPSALLAVADHEIVLKDNHLDILERPEVLSTLEDMLS